MINAGQFTAVEEINVELKIFKCQLNKTGRNWYLRAGLPVSYQMTEYDLNYQLKAKVLHANKISDFQLMQ